MSLYFEELDFRPTPIGALSLRRRRELSLGVDVFEIKLGDEYLMSSPAGRGPHRRRQQRDVHANHRDEGGRS